ncbi:MAG: NAD(P)H-dependent oxidoreductase subunit E [Planctomycetia bacterium]|nr:NAD(P)H-dependent oxidoreductase subunit E [Planctomycetia bacterium]
MPKRKVVICMGSSCFIRGNAQNAEIAEKFIQDHDLNENTDLDICGGLCTENCLNGPIVQIGGTVYKHVDKTVLLELLESELLKTSSQIIDDHK